MKQSKLWPIKGLGIVLSLFSFTLQAQFTETLSCPDSVMGWVFGINNSGEEAPSTKSFVAAYLGILKDSEKAIDPSSLDNAIQENLPFLLSGSGTVWPLTLEALNHLEQYVSEQSNAPAIERALLKALKSLRQPNQPKVKKAVSEAGKSHPFINMYQAGDGYLGRAVLSHRGNYVVSSQRVSDNVHELVVWNPKKNKVKRWEYPCSSWAKVAVSPDEKYVVLQCDQAKAPLRINLRTGEKDTFRSPWGFQKSSPLKIEFLSKYFVQIGYSEGPVRVFNTVSLRPAKSFKLGEGEYEIGDFDWGLNGNEIFFTDRKTGRVHIGNKWNGPFISQRHTLYGRYQLSPDGRYLFGRAYQTSQYPSGIIDTFDLEAKYQIPREYEVRFSPQAHWMAVMNGDGVAMNNIDTKVAYAFPDYDFKPQNNTPFREASVMEFSINGNLLAVSKQSSRVAVYDVDNYSLLKGLDIHPHKIAHIQFSGTGRYLLTEDRGHNIAVWDVMAMRD